MKHVPHPDSSDAIKRFLSNLQSCSDTKTFRLRNTATFLNPRVPLPPSPPWAVNQWRFSKHADRALV